MIPMQKSVDRVQFLTGNREMLLNLTHTPAMPTWSERTVAFLCAFSRNLRSDERTKNFPDISAYAFWIRNASLLQIKEHYYPHVEGKLGRGMSFHIAPSNVPINFAVSFTSSLLAGNSNVVRVSNKNFKQVEIITDALKKTFFDGYQDMEQYLIIIRYEHDEEITKLLSSMCDVRIIWGGDRTINSVRDIKLPPRTIEMTFADRHSIALINSDSVIDADVGEIATAFYTDTYYMDQNACSSPRIVIWLGHHVDAAKKKFWSAVERLVVKDYRYQEILSVDKLDHFCRLAAINRNVNRVGSSNLVMRIHVAKLDENIMDYKFGGGYFFEYETNELKDLLPVLNKPCQTISYFGIDGHKIQKFLIDNGVRGGDRIVPVGKTMDLTFKWDGFDMIESMSRYVYCPDYIR